MERSHESDIVRENHDLTIISELRESGRDAIAANISPEAIALLAPELMRCLRPGGVALVSGFERHETAAVRAALERCGGAVREARYKGSWALAAVTRKSGPPEPPARLRDAD